MFIGLGAAANASQRMRRVGPWRKMTKCNDTINEFHSKVIGPETDQSPQSDQPIQHLTCIQDSDSRVILTNPGR